MSPIPLRTIAFAALCTALLAGCSDKPSPPETTGPAASAGAESGPEPVAAPPDELRPTRGELAAPLPEGVVLPFRYHVRSDGPSATEQGAPRRRMRLEFLEGDVATVAGQVEDALVAAGFTVGGTDTTDAGATRTNYRKDGFGRVTAVVGPTGDAVDPEARGLLILDWPAGDAGGK